MLLRGAVAIATAVLFGSMLGAGTAGADGGCARASSVADDARSLRTAIDSVQCLVNSEREKRGREPVRMSRQLTRAARGHSRDMVRRSYFSHVSLGGSALRDRVAKTGYIRKGRTVRLGETIAYGIDSYASPAQLVDSLMQSSSHKRVLLDRRFRQIGVGMVAAAPESGDGATLTLTFGRR